MPIIGESPTPPSPSPAVGVDRESLILDGLDLNDGGTRTLVGLEFTPAKKLLEWIKGPDSDGSKLLRMARHENSEFDLRIFIRNSTRNLVLDTVGGIIDKLQEAERQSANGGRGLELVWSPMGTTYSYTFYLLAGESNLLRAEDFYKLGKPHLDVKLYCSPFGYGAEVTTSSTVSNAPLVTKLITDVPGDVPAECRITVTDEAVQARDYVAVGLEHYSYNSATSAGLFFATTDFYTGYAGALTTRAASYSAQIVRATLTTTPVAVVGMLAPTHVGTFRNVFRLWPSSLNISVRLAWRQGRDQWTAEPWQTSPFEDAWWEADLGQSKIRAAALGTQSWEWRIEAKSTVAGDTLDVDYLMLVPSGEGYGKARRVAIFDTSTAFSARDEFDQIVGSLTGKTLPVGGTWVGAGDADDFAVETTGKTAQRTATSDPTGLSSGRFAIAGSTNFTNVAVQVDAKSSIAANFSLVHGVVARYTDTDNLAMLRLSGTGWRVYKRIAGTDTLLAIAPESLTGAVTGLPGYTAAASQFHTLRFLIEASGKWAVWIFPTGSSPVLMGTGYDADLATGGVLATGKAGFFDQNIAATAATRNYDNFTIFVPAADAVCFTSQSVEFRSYGDDPVLREDSTGTYWGRPAESRGGRLWLPPAGEEDRTTRVAVMARRNDIETLPNSEVQDQTSMVVRYRPRWVNVPREG